MSSEPPEILRMEGIGRTYDGASETPALANIDLAIRRGEFVAIIGASGAGKSTLLNLLGLLDTATAGRYLVDGHDIAALGERERDHLRSRTFGFVFQDSHVLARETVGSNAALGLSINRVAPEIRPQIVAEALDTVDLRDKSHELAGNLSGGERQRLAIARAIATSPRILLADEPMGSLDSANSDRIIRTLRDLHRAGVTVIMITHDPEIAASADRIIEIGDGRIISDAAVSIDAPVRPVSPDAAVASHVGSQSRWSRVCERVTSAISNHTVHAARAALLLLAFTVGSGGLVTAIGLSQTAAAQVVGRLDTAGLDTFIVVPKPGAEVIMRSELGLASTASAAEIATIAEQRITALDGVRGAGFSADRDFDDRVTLFDPTTVREQPAISPVGRVVDRTYLELQGVEVERGAASLRLFAADARIPAVILGPSLADQLGYDAHSPGAHLWIGSTPVAIVGVITDVGADPRLGSALVANSAVPATGAQYAPTLIVRTEPGLPAELAEHVGLAIAPGDPSLFTAETVADLRALTRDISGDLVALINIVAAVLLVLSSLSAATAASVSVHARSAEIALCRAAGESRRGIWGQFMIEGVTVGIVGGVLGSALGITALVIIAEVQEWVPTFDIRYVGIGLATGAVTGLVASLSPAAAAARQDPALAVRGT